MVAHTWDATPRGEEWSSDDASHLTADRIDPAGLEHKVANTYLELADDVLDAAVMSRKAAKAAFQHSSIDTADVSRLRGFWELVT